MNDRSDSGMCRPVFLYLLPVCTAVIVQTFALNAATASCYIEVFFKHKVCFS